MRPTDRGAPTHVRYTVARARGGVGPTPGITVIATPGAAAAAVMPGVRRTRGHCGAGDARGACDLGLISLSTVDLRAETRLNQGTTERKPTAKCRSADIDAPRASLVLLGCSLTSMDLAAEIDRYDRYDRYGLHPGP